MRKNISSLRIKTFPLKITSPLITKMHLIHSSNTTSPFYRQLSTLHTNTNKYLFILRTSFSHKNLLICERIPRYSAHKYLSMESSTLGGTQTSPCSSLEHQTVRGGRQLDNRLLIRNGVLTLNWQWEKDRYINQCFGSGSACFCPVRIRAKKSPKNNNFVE